MVIPEGVQSQAEAVSGLMDSELTPDELEHIVRVMSERADLRERWTRYHLVRDVLQHTLSPFYTSSLADRVAVALLEVPPPPPLPLRRRMQRPVRSHRRNRGRREKGTAAVAAVTALLLLATPALVSYQAVNPLTDVTVAESNATLAAMPAQVDRYVISYSDYLARSGMANVAPFVHVVSYGE